MQNACSALQIIIRTKLIVTVTAEAKRSAQNKLLDGRRSAAESRAAAAKAENYISFAERFENIESCFGLGEFICRFGAVEIVIRLKINEIFRIWNIVFQILNTIKFLHKLNFGIAICHRKSLIHHKKYSLDGEHVLKYLRVWIALSWENCF